MDKLRRRIICVLFGLAGVLYAAQLFTPLRLTTDSIIYLSLADSISRTGTQALRASDFPFPKGYPLFISLFMKAGIFSSATLVASNIVLFAAGLIFCYLSLIALGFNRDYVIAACLMTLLSFAAVKHITQGMSDFLYFALSACACWLATRPTPYKWVGMLLCAACAIEVRVVGLALIAPIAVIAWPYLRRRPVAVTTAAVVTSCFVGVGAWAGRQYLESNLHIFKSDTVWRFVGHDILAHLQDFGELATNAPLTKLPAWCHLPALTIGVAFMLIFFLGTIAMWRKSQWLTFYLVAYSAVVFPWPYTDPRFWLPVMPFVFITMHAGAAVIFKRVPSHALSTYGAIFCSLGIVALIYSSWITFSGPRFAYRYGDGKLTSTYLANCSGTNSSPNQSALYLLQQYASRCRTAN